MIGNFRNSNRGEIAGKQGSARTSAATADPELWFHAESPEFDADGAIHVRLATNSHDEHVDAIYTVAVNDPAYGFWCWLLAQPSYRRLISDREYREAKTAFDRLNGGISVDDSPDANDVSEQNAVDVLMAFAKIMEDAIERILDASRLPYPKAVIREAFATRIKFLQQCCIEEPENKRWKDDLDRHGALRLRLSDFQSIDESDENAVQEANAGRLDDRRTVLLFLKYHQRGMKEIGLHVDKPLETDGEVISFDELCARFGM